MRIVNVLDDCSSGVKVVGVRNVMEKEEQIVGSGLDGFVNSCDRRRILADVAGTGGHGAIHTYTLLIRAMPLPPAVFFRRFDARAVMAAENIRKRLHA